MKEVFDEIYTNISNDINTLWNLRMVFVILVVFILCTYAINKLD